MNYKVIVVPENTTVSDDSFMISENTDDKPKPDRKQDDCITNDVQKGSWEERALEQKKKQSNLLLDLVSEIQFDD